MKKSPSFWESLEKYGWGVIKRSPLPRYWRWVGIGIVLIVVVSSGVSSQNSVVGVTSWEAVVEKAARLGDYEMARDILNRYTVTPLDQSVLGLESELEDKVYPERAVERRIVEIEEKLREYPENKEIYLLLSRLYEQLGNNEKSREYREKARVLDPNGAEFQ